MTDVSKIPVSQFRTHGDLVFTAGQIGVAADGSIPADFGTQARLALDALATQLAAAGASLSSVLKVSLYIADREDFAEMNEIYVEYFSAPWPTRSTLVTGLALPELRFEVEVVAQRIND